MLYGRTKPQVLSRMTTYDLLGHLYRTSCCAVTHSRLTPGLRRHAQVTPVRSEFPRNVWLGRRCPSAIAGQRLIAHIVAANCKCNRSRPLLNCRSDSSRRRKNERLSRFARMKTGIGRFVGLCKGHLLELKSAYMTA